MVEHHGGAENGCQRVDHALTRDIRRRTVDRLEHRREAAERIEIGAGSQTHTANDGGGEIAQNVAKQIGAHHHVEAFRAAHEIHGGGVHQQRFGFDIGKLRRHIAKCPVPEHHAEALGVGFGDRRDTLFLVARHGQLEGEAHDAFHAAAGEHGSLDGDFFRLLMVDESAHLSVLAFGVFADHHEIDLAALGPGERRPDAWIEIRRAHVGELIEGAPDGEQQAVEGEMVGDVGVADGAEQDGVAGLQQIDGPGRHHASPAEVVFRAPVEILKREGNFVFLRDAFQNAPGLRHDLLAHAVARNHRDRVSFHGPKLDSRTRPVTPAGPGRDGFRGSDTEPRYLLRAGGGEYACATGGGCRTAGRIRRSGS